MKYNQDYHSNGLIILANSKDISNGVITNFKFSSSEPVPEDNTAPRPKTSDEQQDRSTPRMTNQNTISTRGTTGY